jgi:hypothetical protein
MDSIRRGLPYRVFYTSNPPPHEPTREQFRYDDHDDYDDYYDRYDRYEDSYDGRDDEYL